jgi:hypothetical protein
MANIFGPYQKLFWVKGPNFGGEVVVAVLLVSYWWQLRLWIPEVSQISKHECG